MDTTSINQPVVQETKTSRLPAGSTLEIMPGVHVPHPHAEVNMPGAGDPRLGDTKAISEVFINGELKQVPLLDEIKPKAVTVAAPHPGVATLEVTPAPSPVSPSTSTVKSTAASSTQTAAAEAVKGGPAVSAAAAASPAPVTAAVQDSSTKTA